ncbi:MAG: hypothetical protein WAZ34_14285 [Rhodocyclaceae bacterium]
MPGRNPILWIVALLCAMPAAPALAFEWTTTELRLLHSSRYREPSNPDPVRKDILTVMHANGYSLGRNFMFVDILKSGDQERNLSGNREAPTGIYGEAYTTLSLARLSGKSFAAGPVKDLGLTAGINIGDKNSQLHPKPRVYLAGVTIDFAVPRGFFNVDVLAYRDRSCSAGISSCPDYRGTYQITPAWSLPFSLGGIDGEFTGFVDFIGSRGAGTVRQTLAQPQLRFDVGKPFGQKGSVYAGIEYQYWRNKFGIDGVNERHPQLLLLLKF